MNEIPHASYDWEIGLFDIGDCNTCCFAWSCTPFAVIEARAYLDGAPFMFNLGIVPNRWMMRTAYGIGRPDRCVDDWCLGIFCSCCVANQMLQTAKKRGRAVTDGGFEHNKLKPAVADPIKCCSNECCCLFWCLPCKVGWWLEDSVGMPFWTGCCCVNVFAARNVMRYQYRLALPDGTDETLEESMKPWLWNILLNTKFNGLNFGIIFLPVFLWWQYKFATTTQNMVNCKREGDSPGYLVGHVPAIDQHASLMGGYAGGAVIPTYGGDVEMVGQQSQTPMISGSVVGK